MIQPAVLSVTVSVFRRARNRAHHFKMENARFFAEKIGILFI